MNEELLAETLGEDTTTQLYRDGEGVFHIRVMALPEGGGEQAQAADSPRIFQDTPVTGDDARSLFNAAGVKRHVEAEAAFPAS
ncbi:MAG: hypothetical protein IIC13_10395 [SAR324 cluster bacterium]|nr:hypothetical protein [SAR324 cluster bacterium]MCH8886989.1 hypothetical protein [SAR324 cluster bacterium]